MDLSAYLNGKYIVSANEKPDLGVKLAIRDGFISYQNAEMPIGGLNLYTSIELPSLDPEKLHVKIDTFRFSMKKESFHLQMESHGFSEPRINVNADAALNLQNLKKSLGLTGFDMKGEINMHLMSKGKFSRKIIQSSLRKKDTVIASIPVFNLQCSLKNGYIRYNQVSQPLQNIFVDMKAECPDSNYRHAFFRIDSLYATAMNDFIQGKTIVHASTDFPMDTRIKGILNLADIQKIYPMDSLTLSGLLQFDIQNTGKYAPDHHIFPKTNARFSLKDGYIQTKYYPIQLKK